MQEPPGDFSGLDSADGRSVVGRRIDWRRRTASTNDDARRAAEQGEPEGLVVIADEQTAGRGRMSRSWVSPAGRDLLFSVLLRPPARHLPKLPLLAGLAVARALDGFIDAVPTLKWPNDVRVDGRKISGVLVEAGESRHGLHAVVGVGLNVNLDASASPEIADIATSLRTLTGAPADRRVVLRRVLLELDRLYIALGPGDNLVSHWSARLETIGREVEVRWGDETLRGFAEAVDEDGHLLLRTPDGAIHTLDAGEVTMQASPG